MNTFIENLGRHVDTEGNAHTRRQADRIFMTSMVEQHQERQAGGVEHGVFSIDPHSFVPSALLGEEERQHGLGVVDYANSIKGKEEYLQTAQEVHVIKHQLDGGYGTSIERRAYLERVRPDKPTITAKSADLLVDIHNGGESLRISIMELKALQQIAELRVPKKFENTHPKLVPPKVYKRTDLYPVVSQEAYRVFSEFMGATSTPAFGDADSTFYRSALTGSGVETIHTYIQKDLPSINTATGRLSSDHFSSGSHGRPATIMLYEMMEREKSAYDSPRVRVFYNGDGPNNGASPEMVGYTVKERAGIVLLTTTKGPPDKKGGIIGLQWVEKDGQRVQVPQIMELAQAKESGQEDIFVAVGLDNESIMENFPTHQPGEQYFNTNTAILNEALLGDFLPRLREAIGEEAFKRAITPDLIEKPSNDGKHIAVEGAAGSVWLNLARVVETNDEAKAIWQDISGGSKFLQIINIDPIHRDDFFTPIKFAIDFAWMVETDQYEVDIETWKLVNTNPGKMPVLSGMLTDAKGYYADVENCIKLIQGAQVTELEEFHIDGIRDGKEVRGGMVSVAGAKLKGSVHIVSAYDEIYDLNSQQAREQLGFDKDTPLFLENVALSIDPSGFITAQSIA